MNLAKTAPFQTEARARSDWPELAPNTNLNLGQEIMDLTRVSHHLLQTQIPEIQEQQFSTKIIVPYIKMTGESRTSRI